MFTSFIRATIVHFMCCNLFAPDQSGFNSRSCFGRFPIRRDNILSRLLTIVYLQCHCRIILYSVSIICLNSDKFITVYRRIRQYLGLDFL